MAQHRIRSGPADRGPQARLARKFSRERDVHASPHPEPPTGPEPMPDGLRREAGPPRLGFGHDTALRVQEKDPLAGIPTNKPSHIHRVTYPRLFVSRLSDSGARSP